MRTLQSILLLCVLQLSFGQDTWINYSNNYSINDIVETKNGYWTSSTGGLCYYNTITGIETYYNRGNSILPSNNVRDLFMSENGDLWISTLSGLFVFKNGQIELGPQDLSGIINETIDNKIIVAHYDSLFIQKEGMDFEGIPYPEYSAGVSGLEVDQETGAIFINVINYFGESYIGKWYNDEWTIIFSSFIYETSIVMDQNNRLWFASSLGIQYYEDEKWTRIDADLVIREFDYTRLFINKDNHLIIEVTSGMTSLKIWDGTEFKKLDYFDELCDDCYFIKPSVNQSDLYFSSSKSKGFYMFNSKRIFDFIPLSQSPIYSNRVLNTLHPSNGMHIIIFFDKIQVIESGNWIDIPVPSELSGVIKNGFLDKEESLWIYDDNFLWNYRDNKWIKLLPPNEMTSSLQMMEIGKNGDIWIQSRKQIARYKNNKWVTFNTSQHGITNSNIRAMKVDPENGDLWVTYFRGTKHYDGVSWTNYDNETSGFHYGLALGDGGAYVKTSNGMIFIKDGVVEIIPLPEDITYINYTNFGYDDTNGKLYLPGSLLSVYEDEEWTIFSPSTDGYYSGSNSIAFDQHENVWFFGFSGGITIFNEDGIKSISAKKSEIKSPDKFISIYPTIIADNYFYLESDFSGDHELIFMNADGKVIHREFLEMTKNEITQVICPEVNSQLLLVTVRHKDRMDTEKILINAY